MNRQSLRSWLNLAVLICLAAAAITFAASPPATSQPATISVSASDADRAYALLSEGIEQSQRGQFSGALALLEQAVKLAPSDAKIAEARGLLKDYVARQQRDEAERAAEYALAVEKVGWAKLARENLSRLKEAGIYKNLRDRVRDVVAAVGRCANGDALDDAAKDTYEQVKSDSITALDDALAALDKAEGLLVGDDGEYARVFRQTAGTERQRLLGYRKLWSDANVEDAAGRRQAARQIRSAEEPLYEGLEDLDGLATDKPWREALARAIAAQRVALPSDDMTGQQWYKELVADIERRGDQFVKDGEWPDALASYVGLKELDENNETYREKAKQVRQHVRVLRLYGKAEGVEEDKAPTPQTKPAEVGPTWQELVSGADAEMAEKAISQLDSYYVTAVDYRKLARGALSAVKVLAETPQVVATFPLLANEQRRQAFVQDVDNQLSAVESRDRVDHLDLTLALNSVLRSSERTVKIPTEVLVVEFTDGFLEEMDEFSSMIWPHDIADFQKQTMGHFYGVGIQIGKEIGEPLRVVTPLADSPALKAGVRPGDLILAVDGRPTEDIGVDKLVRMITGEKGTKVTLTIKRAGRVEPFDLTLTRQEISIATVRGWQSTPDGHWDYLIDHDNKIGYIRLIQFTDQTGPDLAKVLEDLSGQGVRSLVVDLRFNPGGLLNAATEVSDEFLESGRIVSTEGRQTRRQQVNASPSGEYTKGDLVLLTNQISASAAEIFSGAMKDWHRGLLVGRRTYGKGSVQNVISIRRGRAVLKLTTAYYYLPSGRLLHRRIGQKDWGVDPDIDVQMTLKQTRRWLSVREKTDLIVDVDPVELKSDLARQYDADTQLATAVLLLRLRQLQEGPQMVTPPATASLEPALR